MTIALFLSEMNLGINYMKFTGNLFLVTVSASVQRAFQSHQHKYKVKITKAQLELKETTKYGPTSNRKILTKGGMVKVKLSLCSVN
jgi:hypothetical protein